MSFVTKEWKDRLAEFAGRRKLTNVSTGEETTVDVSRAEGEVSQAGDAFSAANMNDLEQRIKDGFDKVENPFIDPDSAVIIDPKSYTSVSNPYVVPYDGFIVVSTGYNNKGYAIISVGMIKSDNTQINVGSAVSYMGYINSFSFYVKKGQKIIYNTAENRWGTDVNSALFKLLE